MDYKAMDPWYLNYYGSQCGQDQDLGNIIKPATIPKSLRNSSTSYCFHRSKLERIHDNL